MGGALGGRARPERPWDAVFSLRHEGHQGISQPLGLLGHRLAPALVVRGFVVLQALLDVSAAVCEQVIDPARQLMRGRRDGLGGAEPCLHPSEEGAQGPRRVGQTAGGKAQGDGDARRAGAHAPRQHLPTRDVVLGTPPQPTTAVLHARPPGHVRADLTAEDQGRVVFAPLDSGQVDARQARERGAGLEPGGVGCLVAAGLGGQGLARPFLAKGLQVRRDLLIAVGALLVGAGLQRARWASGKQGLGAPGALQRLGDVGLRVVAGRVAQRRQRHRIACAGDEGFEEGHAGHPRDLPDDLGERERHLFSGLGHMRNMVGGVGEQQLAVAQVPAAHAPLIGRAEGPGEQPVSVQALEPLTVEPSGLRSTGGARGLAGIDEEPLHAPGR